MPPAETPSISAVINAVSPPVLQHYRLTDDRLILHLTQDCTSFTRHIRLGAPEAGLCSYSEVDGLAVFARGARSKPRTLRGGDHPTPLPYPGAFLVRGDRAQLAGLAAKVWPIMRSLAAEGARVDG